MKIVQTPINYKDIEDLEVGDMFYISGDILCGRDAVLPKIVKELKENDYKYSAYDLNGSVIFHTAISVAGLGPTSSNKLEIEESIPDLSKAGVRIHLGKGKISEKTIKILNEENSIYAIIPPVSALLKEKMSNVELISFPELGMEALYKIHVKEYPAIVGAIKGRSIYEQ